METSAEPERWKSLTLDALRAAMQGVTVKDFKMRARLERPEAGFAPFDRLNAAEFLIKNGVISVVDERLKVENLLGIDWLLEDATNGNAEVWSALEKLPPNVDSTRKFNDQLARQVGLRGEEFVVATIKDSLDPQLHHLVKHVSLHNDTLGFDVIAPNPLNTERNVFLEIKTTSRPGENFRFHLTRNEYRAGLDHSNWGLCAVRLENGQGSIEAFLNVGVLERLVPVDQSMNATWSVVTFEIDVRQYCPDVFEAWLSNGKP